MGTDIHGYWELKTSEDVWLAFRPVNEGRNYEWFGILANVRGTGAGAWAARGMPPQPSAAWETYTGYGNIKKNWLHNLTWLTYDEVIQANKIRSALLFDDSEEAGHEAPDWELVPTPDEELEQIYLAGDREPTLFPWFGKLSELVSPHEFDTRLRMVVAFDS